jgi:tryptophan halogenase
VVFDVKKIVVLGGGSAGFLSAVTLKRLLPNIQICCVYSSRIPEIGVGESTTAYLPTFLHRTLQLDPARFYREVKPSWKLGIKFIWGAADTPHFNYTFDGILGLRPDLLGKRTSYYCLDDSADYSHFSALMDRDLAPFYRGRNNQIQMQSGYGYHIQNKPFLNYLKSVAEQLGVEVIDGEVTQVIQAEDGGVQSLKFADGREVPGDMFVDSSGFRSMLLKQTMGEKFVSYENSLFCDKAIVGSWSNADGTINPYTTAETMDHGWCWRIDFDDHVTRGYVYSSQFCDEETATAELRAKNPKIGDVRSIGFTSGRYENFWNKNVVAIGNSSGFVEPLEATALHLIAQQLTSLAGVLVDGDGRVWPEVIQEENRQFRRSWDEVRDFLALHYKFNFHSDTPFWKQCQNDTELGFTKELVEMYAKIGPHRSCEGLIALESMFSFDGYLAMLIGMKIPTEYKNRFSADDQADYSKYRDRIRTDVSHGLTVRQTHAAIGNNQFQWPK